VKDGRIVLNVAQRAVAGLEMTNDIIRFSARFGGVSHAVSVPVSAVLAIYARENGQGMALPPESEDGEAAAGIGMDDGEDVTPSLELVQDAGDDSRPDDEPPTPPRRGHLRIVK
jgi:stringent starvation protein B